MMSPTKIIPKSRHAQTKKPVPVWGIHGPNTTYPTRPRRIIHAVRATFRIFSPSVMAVALGPILRILRFPLYLEHDSVAYGEEGGYHLSNTFSLAGRGNHHKCEKENSTAYQHELNRFHLDLTVCDCLVGHQSNALSESQGIPKGQVDGYERNDEHRREYPDW